MAQVPAMEAQWAFLTGGAGHSSAERRSESMAELAAALLAEPMAGDEATRTGAAYSCGRRVAAGAGGSSSAAPALDALLAGLAGPARNEASMRCASAGLGAAGAAAVPGLLRLLVAPASDYRVMMYAADAVGECAPPAELTVAGLVRAALHHTCNPPRQNSDWNTHTHTIKVEWEYSSILMLRSPARAFGRRARMTGWRRWRRGRPVWPAGPAAPPAAGSGISPRTRPKPVWSVAHPLPCLPAGLCRALLSMEAALRHRVPPPTVVANIKAWRC